MRKQVKLARNRRIYKKYRKVFIFCGCFIVIGSITLLLSARAATFATAVESESGSTVGNATVISDASASNGEYVQFGSTSSGSTMLHYAANGNFDSNGNYLPGAYGFNVADISSASELNGLPAGVEGLAWIGACNGADSAFQSTVQAFVGKAKLFGFYVMDEPDPPNCPAANLKAESDYIHAHVPSAKTYIVMDVQTESSNPSYANTYNPGNSDIDLYGLDPYPCRTELNGCDYSYITKAVTAAQAAGIPRADIVPVFQAFGGGGYVDDGGGKYLMPTAAQETQILSTWVSAVPHPVFDHVYSWGVQNSDTALVDSPEVQQVFAQHNQ